jgi:hypothetical protein
MKRLTSSEIHKIHQKYYQDKAYYDKRTFHFTEYQKYEGYRFFGNNNDINDFVIDFYLENKEMFVYDFYNYKLMNIII